MKVKKIKLLSFQKKTVFKFNKEDAEIVFDFSYLSVSNGNKFSLAWL